MKSLYISRSLKNTDDLVEWARAQGFTSILEPKDLHTTIAFSRTPVDWNIIGDSFDIIRVPFSDMRSVEKLGDKGAIVLRFESTELAWRWQQILDLGGSWDHNGYKPHLTITYNSHPNIQNVVPFTGKLIFGPERFAEVEEDWDQQIEERDL